MPTKPIIDIDINDKQFKDFYRLFEQYKEDLGEMPDSWKTINDHARKGMDAFSAVVGAMLESMTQAAGHAKSLAENLSAATEAQKQFGHAAHAGEKGLKSMAKDAKSIAEHIFGVGKFLFKTGAWGAGIFGGLTFGYDKLAQGAVGTQREARGLGLTPGQLRAFGTDLGRYTSQGTLSTVANAKNNYLGRSMLSLATGLSQQQIMSMDAGTISGRLLRREHELWASTPAAQRPTLAMLPQYKFLGQTTEDFYRAGAASPEEIRRAQAQYAKDARSLNYGNRSTDALYAFTRQLALAGQSIQTHLIKRLAELGPSMGHLMTSLGQSANILIDQVFTKKNIDALRGGIEDFASYIGSKDFRNDVRNFVGDIKSLVEGLKPIVHLLGKTGTGIKKAESARQYLVAGGASDFELLAKGKNWLADHLRLTKSSGAPYGHASEFAKLFHSNEVSFGLPAGILKAQAFVESGGNPNAVSSKGAVGLMQLMPKTAASYHVNPLDPRASVGVAAMENARNLRTLRKRYKGYSAQEQINMMLASYNWGIGNVEKDVDKYGANWRQHVPQETNEYIKKVLRAMAQNQSKAAHVTVTNKSGTNVAVSTNAAGL